MPKKKKDSDSDSSSDGGFSSFLDDVTDAFSDVLSTDDSSSDSSNDSDDDSSSSSGSGPSSGSGDNDTSSSSDGTRSSVERAKKKVKDFGGRIAKGIKARGRKLHDRLRRGELPSLPTKEWQARIVSAGGKVTGYGKREHERAVQAEKAGVSQGSFIGRQAERVLMGVGDKGAEVITDLVADKLKEALKDDAMPSFVKRGIDGIVDEVMPEVEEEIKYATVGRLRKRVPIDQGKPVPFCPNPLAWIRAKILYTLFPFDKTIWDKFRDPFWWILTLIMAFPRYGVHQAAFLILLLLKDKRDEFQLLNFIMAFKGMAFISQGLIPITVGAVRLYNCAVLATNPTCNDLGAKGAPRTEYFEVGFFALQAVLIFIAFALVPFSQKKGAYRYANPSTKELDQTADCLCCTRYKGRGGRLMAWVVYEIIIFAICAGLVFWATFESSFAATRDDFDAREWRLQGTYYWIKVMYGMLSMPYILFKLPLMFGLLTHAKETGYNKNGKTVPIVKKENVGDKKKKKSKKYNV